MKTSELIDLLCTAISAVDYATREAVRSAEDGQIDGTAHLLLSNTSKVFRELFDRLPEGLADEEYSEHVANLYPHKYENVGERFGWADWDEHVSGCHSAAYKMWQELDEARTKFDL